MVRQNLQLDSDGKNLFQPSDNKEGQSDIHSLCESFHGRIDWDIAKELSNVLYEQGATKRTRLATKIKANYDTCKRHVHWMQEIGWIKENEISGEVGLTEPGLFICARIFRH
jgi:predicted transcriptional regulator